jgi:hypothetical protein
MAAEAELAESACLVEALDRREVDAGAPLSVTTAGAPG